MSVGMHTQVNPIGQGMLHMIRLHKEEGGMVHLNAAVMYIVTDHSYTCSMLTAKTGTSCYLYTDRPTAPRTCPKSYPIR